MRHARPRYALCTTHVAIFLSIFFAMGIAANAQGNPQSNSPSNSSTPSAASPLPGASGDVQSAGLPSLLTPLKPQTQQAPYSPIRPRQRLRWFITNTIGPPHLVGGLFVSSFGTAVNRPKEYGTHWHGFADRYGMRMTGIVTGNAMEASLGYLLQEDPRYFRVPDRPLKTRFGNAVRLTFVARGYSGSFRPAYARYIAISGNNFLSNSWRVQSEANTKDALLRTAEGFAGRMVANTFEEFWPDIKKYVFHKQN